MKKRNPAASLIIALCLIGLLYPLYYYGFGLFEESVYLPRRGVKPALEFFGIEKNLLCLSIIIFVSVALLTGGNDLIRSVKQDIDGDEKLQSPSEYRLALVTMVFALFLFLLAIILRG